MPDSVKSFKHHSLEDRESLVQYLQSLTQAIKNGQLALSSGEKTLQLQPDGLIQFRLEAKRGSHRHRLHLRMSWRSDPNVETPAEPRLGIGSSDRPA